jgi:outer membrane biogenesis lipoprotein LolB
MKKLLAVTTLILLTGCSTVKDWWPSRWDVNQSKAVTDVQQTTRNFDCKGDITAQTKTLATQVEWLDIYSQTKGTRDVVQITSMMKETTKELQDRIAKGPVSPMYCDLKKKILIQQADIIGTTIQGRF